MTEIPVLTHGHEPESLIVWQNRHWDDRHYIFKTHFWMHPLWASTVAQLLKKSPAVHGTQTFITVFTRARHWSLSRTRWIQPIFSSYFPKIQFSNILLPTSLSLGFLTKSLWAVLFYFSLLHSVQTDCGAHSASYIMVTGECFPGDKAAGAWSWLLTLI
jgi:hypothetical protein